MNKILRLQEKARLHGIQTSFIDSLGKEQFASIETLRLLLERLGVSDADESRPTVDPVIVSWQRTKAPLKMQVNEKPRHLELQLAGSDRRSPIKAFRLEQLSKNSFQLRVPLSGLPTGYHDLLFATKSGEHRSMVISAPRKLYSNPHRQWGAFLPLYAAHSSKSWGAGNFSDWQELARWVGKLGGTVVGTLPIMSAVLDHPKCDPSPYSPFSRLFWNEFFIDVTAIPEFNISKSAAQLVASSNFLRALQHFREKELIDYPAQWAARRQVLQILAKEFFATDSPRSKQFHSYLRSRPQVEDYARFRAAGDRSGRAWHPRRKAVRPSDFDPALRDFYLYVQWIAQEQIDHVLAFCRDAGVKFYLDLPLGVNPEGFDAWHYREFFAQQVSAGAPPDAFFTKGQDWGFAPLDPRRTRELRYQYVIDYLRFQMRHTGLLRIDHVMGLHRLWWVPHGQPASAGAYVRYPAEELYAILSVESHLHQTALVGENLGTVPPEVNKSMDRHGLRRMYVAQYEQPVQGRLREPEPQVVASVNTHDMPTFAAYWKGLDILDRADLGLITQKEIALQKRQRAALRQSIVQFLKAKKLLPRNLTSMRAIFDGILRFLARSPAETVLVNLEDLWAELRPQNVPGTCAERPNWRKKARRSIDQILADKKLAARLKDVLTR